jgi:hypothetical protein
VDVTAKDDQSLTGVWHGLYTYVSHPHLPQSHFICVLIDNGGRLSGTIHEVMNHYRSAPSEAFALVDGAHCGGHVTFLKTYDGTGGQTHSVSYAGDLNGEQDEIEGGWRIDSRYGVMTGQFLMIRKRGQGEARAVLAEAHEKAKG